MAILAAALAATWLVLSLMFLTNVFARRVPPLDAIQAAFYLPGPFVARMMEALDPTAGPTLAFFAASVVVLVLAACAGAAAALVIRHAK